MPDVASGWDSGVQELESFRGVAAAALEELVSGEVMERARSCGVEVFSVGVDVRGVRGLSQTHAELVATVELGGGDVRWTGKSYPLPAEERTLVQEVDLGSHVQELAGERVAVLGCHDLNVFNPRGRAALREGSRRHRRVWELVRVLEEFRPTVVLQHPHTTDSPNIWRNAWGRLLEELPSVRHWAGGVRYFNPRGEVRGTLEDVLKTTASRSRQDFVV